MDCLKSVVGAFIMRIIQMCRK